MPCNKGQGDCRCKIQPLVIVDDANERLLYGNLRKQAKYGEGDVKSVRGGADSRPKAVRRHHAGAPGSVLPDPTWAHITDGLPRTGIPSRTRPRSYGPLGSLARDLRGTPVKPTCRLPVHRG